MTPQELSSQVEEERTYLASLPKDDVDPGEEWDAVADFWEAIELMQTSLHQMELLCKIDLDLKFLNKRERAQMMTHTAELMTFIDLFVDPEAK